MTETTEAPARQTLTERFRGKIVKSFTGHSERDFTDPKNSKLVLVQLDIIFEDDTKLTVSAKQVDMTIIVRPIQVVRLGPEERMRIKTAKLVCE